MKAVGYKQSLPIQDVDSLQDIELPQPEVSGQDLLVNVSAIAVNPVDYKIRQNVTPEADEYKVLGWDAVGEIVAVGELVTDFVVGEHVYYAGDLTRQGCNAEYQLVDQRLASIKPKSLTAASAAALPLTAITAWEVLFDHLGLQRQDIQLKIPTNELILVTGAAGGVGSILIQLVKVLTGAQVIATASREETQAWVKSLGADYVIDHSQALKPQVDALIKAHNLPQVSHVASLNQTQDYLAEFVDILKPFGKICLIDDPQNMETSIVKTKSISLHWEFMMARSMHQACDMAVQGQILAAVASLIDQGYIKTTIKKNLGVIDASNLRQAHQELEAGAVIGKMVLEGF